MRESGFFCGQKGAQENERKKVLYAAFGRLWYAPFFNQRVRVFVTNELLQIDLLQMSSYK